MFVSTLSAHGIRTHADSTGSRVWDSSWYKHSNDIVNGYAYSKDYLALGEL